MSNSEVVDQPCAAFLRLTVAKLSAATMASAPGGSERSIYARFNWEVREKITKTATVQSSAGNTVLILHVNIPDQPPAQRAVAGVNESTKNLQVAQPIDKPFFAMMVQAVT